MTMMMLLPMTTLVMTTCAPLTRANLSVCIHVIVTAYLYTDTVLGSNFIFSLFLYSHFNTSDEGTCNIYSMYINADFMITFLSDL